MACERGVSRGRCGIIVETAGNRREQGDGDGDGEGQQGGVQLSAMRTALFSFPLAAAAAARLAHSAEERFRERTKGGVVVDVAKRKIGGRRDVRRWASDRLHQTARD